MADGLYGGGIDPAGSFSSRLRGSENFPSPFLDMASMAMPANNKNALEWCEHIYMANETLRMALDRIVSYFLTDIEIGAASKKKPIGEDEKDKWASFLNDDLNVLSHIRALNNDLMCYGNGFISIIVPFSRMLMCKNCKSMSLTLREVYENPVFKFNFSNFEHHATCPNCGYAGSWLVKDEPTNTPSKLRLHRWNPKDMVILQSPITDECEYYLKIPETYKTNLKGNKPPLFHLERTNLQMIKAIKHNQLYKFLPDTIYHMREPALAGLDNRGWGVSRLITSFRQVWYVQVLRRYNEAIALDYVIPFRLITPSERGGSATAGSRDLLLSSDAGDFMAQVRSMIRRRRRNPSEWFTLPFSVDYKILGGDAQQLAPKDLLDQGLEVLLNGLGTPVELYKGSLQLQTAPVAMRLFEATWYHLVNGNNNFLRWLTRRIAAILSWESVDARHRRVQHADDMQRHMALLQLMMGGTISQTSGLRALGLEFLDEQRQMAEEARSVQQQQEDMQSEQETASFGKQVAQGGQPMPPGAMPPGAAAGGAPAGPVDPATGQPIVGPVTSMVQNNYLPQTPDEMLAAAASLAQQLLGLPESQKDSELRMLKQKNQVLHSLVRSEIDRIRSQARSQGGSAMMQQQFGGAPPAM